jgi:hypothetical protein
MAGFPTKQSLPKTATRLGLRLIQVVLVPYAAVIRMGRAKESPSLTKQKLGMSSELK